MGSEWGRHTHFCCQHNTREHPIQQLLTLPSPPQAQVTWYSFMCRSTGHSLWQESIKRLEFMCLYSHLDDKLALPAFTKANVLKASSSFRQSASDPTLNVQIRPRIYSQPLGMALWPQLLSSPSHILHLLHSNEWFVMKASTTVLWLVYCTSLPFCLIYLPKVHWCTSVSLIFFFPQRLHWAFRNIHMDLPNHKQSTETPVATSQKPALLFAGKFMQISLRLQNLEWYPFCRVYTEGIAGL